MRSGLAVLVLKVANVALGLALAIVLARALGPEDYGIYSYIFVLISVLSIPSLSGLPKLIVRETAKAQVNEQWGLMLGIWRWSGMVAGVLFVISVVIALVVLLIFEGEYSPLQIDTFLWGLLLMPLMVLGSLRDAALQGLRKVVIGSFCDAVFRPACFVLMVGVLIFWGANRQLTPATAMGLHALAAFLAFLMGAWLLFRNRPDPLRTDPLPQPIYHGRNWLFSIWPLALAAAMQQIMKYTDILMLGFFVSAAEIGIYRVASQGSILVVFGLQAIAVVVQPYFARMHAIGDMGKLQLLVTLSSLASFLVALPVLLMFIFFGEELLVTIFGEAFGDGHAVLIFLAVSQQVNAAFGAVGFLLNMTGYEKKTALGLSIAALLNIPLNLLLIPVLGINGAAIATAISMTIWNVILWKFAYTHLQIDCMMIHVRRLLERRV
jgi:O-antigen/teichoic acid export membrane protein